MYAEKRQAGKNLKYYLVHSYREKGKVRKIRKYLGQNLAREELEKAKNEAEKHILGLLKELNTEVFLFTLTKNQVEKLNRLDERITIAHFNQKEWQRFTEEFVYNTNAIEGSTVQREEVPEILHYPSEEQIPSHKHSIGGQGRILPDTAGVSEQQELKVNC